MSPDISVLWKQKHYHSIPSAWTRWLINVCWIFGIMAGIKSCQVKGYIRMKKLRGNFFKLKKPVNDRWWKGFYVEKTDWEPKRKVWEFLGGFNPPSSLLCRWKSHCCVESQGERPGERPSMWALTRGFRAVFLWRVGPPSIPWKLKLVKQNQIGALKFPKPTPLEASQRTHYEFNSYDDGNNNDFSHVLLFWLSLINSSCPHPLDNWIENVAVIVSSFLGHSWARRTDGGADSCPSPLTLLLALLTDVEEEQRGNCANSMNSLVEHYEI